MLDYSFSKGHLTYLAGDRAVQNTLLLHDDADSITFYFEAGTSTESVKLTIQHPLLNDSNAVLLYSLNGEGEASEAADASSKTPAMEYQLDLPAGPLYGRITVETSSTVCFFTQCVMSATTYMFHIIRVGEMISFSLKGQVSGTDSPKDFVEQRSWLYQQRSPEWYIPEFQPHSLASLEVTLRPVCFAPLREWSGRSSRLVQYAQECQCGEESTEGTWLGNECWKEVDLQLLNASSGSTCLFLRKTSVPVMDELKVPGRKGRLCGHDVVEWLQDVKVSGKFAKLVSDLESSEAPEKPDARLATDPKAAKESGLLRKELKSSYYTKETLSYTIYPYHGNPKPQTLRTTINPHYGSSS